MTPDPPPIDLLYREHGSRVLAVLIRSLGDYALAEEAMQEAFAAAVRQSPMEGVPKHPAAWLIRTGQRRGIDQIRRAQTARQYAHLLAPEDEAVAEIDEQYIEDSLLRLLFTCCHPGLSLDARVALTLREMCGLTTEQVARGLFQQPATLAQRIVRAKKKIRAAAIPYEIPEGRELPDRLPREMNVHVGVAGNCREAMRFYADVTGGHLEALITVGETPAANEFPPERHDDIIHASLNLRGRRLMGADMEGDCYEEPRGAQVYLEYDSPAEAERVFTALAEGGEVIMPFEQTFWAHRFGMTRDRFGIQWMISCQLEQCLQGTGGCS